MTGGYLRFAVPLASTNPLKFGDGGGFCRT